MKMCVCVVLGDVCMCGMYMCEHAHVCTYKIRPPLQITYSYSLFYPAMFGWKLTLIADKESIENNLF